jgi:transposase
MTPIGVDVVERGEVIPAQVLVNRYEQSKYACPKGHEVKTASAPAALIDRCKFEASGFAAIVTAKFVDHIPLARQEAMWKRRGMPIARSTMCDMVLRVAELFEPIVMQMRREILTASVLHADETPIQVQVEGQKGTKTGCMWVYIADDRVAFDFTMGRGRDGPIRFLQDFDGALVTDAYAGYDEVERKNGITRIGCWAHARRRFKEARDVQGEIADEALFLIARFYRVEKFVDAMAEKQGLDEEAHRALRADARKRLNRRVLARLDHVGRDLENERSVLPKSAIGKAVRYLGGQWDRLTRFIDDPDIPLDNNAAERALRAVAIGRKNYLFAGSERGGRAAATHYAVTASCKVLGIDPMVYIEDVLKRVSTTPAAEVAALTPWAWAHAHRSD